MMGLECTRKNESIVGQAVRCGNDPSSNGVIIMPPQISRNYLVMHSYRELFPRDVKVAVAVVVRIEKSVPGLVRANVVHSS